MIPLLDIREVFSTLLGLFLLIGVGYLGAKTGVVPLSASKPLTSLLMNITMPATIFVSLVRPYDPAFVREGLIIVGLGFFLFFFHCILNWGLSFLCRVGNDRRGCWVLTTTFCNNGFMGFPIALALFGDEGLALAAFLGIPFNILVYTIGPKLAAMDRVSDGPEAKLSWRGVLFTMVNLATLLGLIFYIGQIPIPLALSEPLNYLSNVTTPLSMMITGMNLTLGSIRSVFRDKDLFSSAFLRLLGLPMLTYVTLCLLPIPDPIIVGVTLIILSMPSPAIASILTETYGGNKEFAAQSVFLSSLLCLVTIPLISLLL